MQTTVFVSGDIVESSAIGRVGENVVRVSTAHFARAFGNIVEALVNVLLVDSQSFDLSSHLTLRFYALFFIQHVSVRGAIFFYTVIGFVIIQHFSLL